MCLSRYYLILRIQVMILKFCLASLKGFLPQNFNIIQSSMAHKWLLSLKASDIAEKSTYHKCSELSSIQKQINYIFLLCKRKRLLLWLPFKWTNTYEKTFSAILIKILGPFLGTPVCIFSFSDFLLTWGTMWAILWMRGGQWRKQLEAHRQCRAQFAKEKGLLETEKYLLQ